LAPSRNRAAEHCLAAVAGQKSLEYPIEVLDRFQRVAVDEAQSSMASDVGSYCVAIELALQGLEKAAINTNLAAREKVGFFDRLKAKRHNIALPRHGVSTWYDPL
jgi:hypothetical protein